LLDVTKALASAGAAAGGRSSQIGSPSQQKGKRRVIFFQYVSMS
jgi:hypothetical protein